MKVAIELIWNKEQTKIVDFKWLDKDTLSKMYSEDGTFVWVQNSNDPINKRILNGTQIATNF